MNKKMIIGSLVVVFMFVAISFVSAAGNKEKFVKESPLFKIRTGKASLKTFKEGVKSYFVNHILLSLPTLVNLERYENSFQMPSGYRCTLDWPCPTFRKGCNVNNIQLSDTAMDEDSENILGGPLPSQWDTCHQLTCYGRKC